MASHVQKPLRISHFEAEIVLPLSAREVRAPSRRVPPRGGGPPHDYHPTLPFPPFFHMFFRPRFWNFFGSFLEPFGSQKGAKSGPKIVQKPSLISDTF